MAELGELVLWAAFPVAALAVCASMVGVGRHRADLALAGGRAATAASILLFIALVGLGHALLTVKLRYEYVASYSGFQDSWPSRLASVWSGPAGGSLLIAWLLITASAVAAALGHSRRSALQTGLLATLSLVALLVVARARPFGQLEIPALRGEGLPLVARTLAWQIEAWANYLAVACAAFAFSGVAATRLSESVARRRRERAAVALVAGMMTLAVVAAAWRAYEDTGRLLDGYGLGLVIVHVPAWLVAVAYLHAPDRVSNAGWSDRWQRILGLALFPTVLGSGAALLAGLDASPPAIVWVGGLAVGMISGFAAGIAGRRRRGELDGLPGFGPFALLGVLLTLALAGLLAVWGLRGSDPLLRAAGVMTLGVIVAMTVWSVHRSAGAWRRPWAVAIVASAMGSAAGYGVRGGHVPPSFLIACALFAAVVVGVAAEIVRVVRVGHSWQGKVDIDTATAQKMIRWRGRRRLASAAGHLGVALVVLGLAGEKIADIDTVRLRPGAGVTIPGVVGEGVRLTYLGLSRYQVGVLEKRVASFRLDRDVDAKGPATLVTASLNTDLRSGRQVNELALQRGAMRDIVVGISSLADAEGIFCRYGTRPLASLFWVGAALLLISLSARVSGGP